MLYSYSFENRKRDLTDILSTLIKDEPRFISNFRCCENAKSDKHVWNEDELCARAVTVEEIHNSTLFMSPKEANKLNVGTLLVFGNNSALFEITDVRGEYADIVLAAKNGSDLTDETLPKDGGVFRIVSNPVEDSAKETVTKHNFVQSFKKAIVVSESVISSGNWGNIDNNLNRQTAVSLSDLARDLNRVAIFGRCVNGEAGGLYNFATGYGALEIDAKSAVLDSYLVNEAAQMVIGEGAEPNQIMCSPGQARIICNKYKDHLQVLRSDDRRGAYVAVIVNEINGRGVTIMADPDMPDTECWVVDKDCFALSFCGNVEDTDTTPAGFDGIRRTVTGKFTFEFKNAKQRCCRIKNIKSSYEVLKGLKTK